ncbi:MAG: TolC family protein [Steroidobacteraceae bacterium]
MKITVAAETARAYAQVCALGEAIAVARHSIDVVTHEQQITMDRRDAGAAADFDVVRAQTLVAQVRAALPPLTGQRQAALFQLAQLLGRVPGALPPAAEACVQPPTLKALLPVGDGGMLLGPATRCAPGGTSGRRCHGAHRGCDVRPVSAHLTQRQLWRHRHPGERRHRQRGTGLGYWPTDQLELSQSITGAGADPPGPRGGASRRCRI